MKENAVSSKNNQWIINSKTPQKNNIKNELLTMEFY